MLRVRDKLSVRDGVRDRARDWVRDWVRSKFDAVTLPIIQCSHFCTEFG